MIDSLSYERVLTPPKGRATRLPRLRLALLYLIAVGIWILLFIKLTLSAPLILLAVLSLLLLILPTMKYGSFEYEYIFTGGMLYCAKIYGKRKRVQFAEVELAKAILIAPDTPEYRKQAERSDPSTVIYATVDDRATDIWLILLPTSETDTAVLFFHGDERSLRILRKANPRATVRVPNLKS